jgi:hypothetical protein
MEIEISSDTKLTEIRAAFKAQFPFLDIAFFSKAHGEGSGSTKQSQLPYTATFEEAGDPHRIGLLQITGDQTCAFTETEFETGFGLYVQILRKSGNLWLQTTTSDELTLTELNSETEAAETFQPDKAEPEDIHEQE